MAQKTRLIQVRVTRDQMERIKDKSKSRGFGTVSEYVRNIALREDLLMEYKINAIYERIINCK